MASFLGLGFFLFFVFSLPGIVMMLASPLQHVLRFGAHQRVWLTPFSILGDLKSSISRDYVNNQIILEFNGSWVFRNLDLDTLISDR